MFMKDGLDGKKNARQGSMFMTPCSLKKIILYFFSFALQDFLRLSDGGGSRGERGQVQEAQEEEKEEADAQGRRLAGHG